MNLTKSYEFFQPDKVNERIHIIGCGSVGSTIAENLARCGLKKLTLWDFDKVEDHNVANQMFVQDDVGEFKADALKRLLVSINPEAKDTIEVKLNGWQGELISGIVFLAVDSIDIRRQFVETHMNSPFVRAVFDVRTLLTGAQTYGCPWDDYKKKQEFLKTMQFSHEEAADETPVSACGVTLGVVTTVRIVSAICVNNFIRYMKGEGIWKFAQFDGFAGVYDFF